MTPLAAIFLTWLLACGFLGSELGILIFAALTTVAISLPTAGVDFFSEADR